MYGIVLILVLIITGGVIAVAIGVARSSRRNRLAAQQAVWGRRPVVAGTPLAKPSPLFRKLDEKLATEGPSWAPIRA